jgi:hypothetical protein
MRYSQIWLKRWLRQLASTFSSRLALNFINNDLSERVDDRDRRDRIENQNSNWDLQMDCLVDAYLDYREWDGGDGLPNPPPTANHQTGIPFQIELIDVFCKYCFSARTCRWFYLAKRQTTFSPTAADTFPNETLIRNGFLGCSAFRPTVAISIRTLAAYRQSHRTCPRFSLQAQAKALCHLHNVRRRLHWSNG